MVLLLSVLLEPVMTAGYISTHARDQVHKRAQACIRILISGVCAFSAAGGNVRLGVVSEPFMTVGLINTCVHHSHLAPMHSHTSHLHCRWWCAWVWCQSLL